MRQSFAERLKAERARAGLSQAELGRKCGLSSATISHMECGQGRGSEKAQTALARALGLSTEWLMTGSGPREGDWWGPPRNVAPQPFADRLRQLRTEAGLSQRQLAIVIGVATGTVSAWETGIREFPAGDNLVRLAEALGLDPTEVMRFDGKITRPQSEAQLLAAFRMLSEEKKLEAVKLVEALKVAAR